MVALLYNLVGLKNRDKRNQESFFPGCHVTDLEPPNGRDQSPKDTIIYYFSSGFTDIY